MKTFARCGLLLLLASTMLCGCSMLTAQGRQERAYQHYVQKMSRGRLKQQKKISALRAKVPPSNPTEATITLEASGPETVATSEGSGGL